jgi:hypothetical protein
MGNTTSNNFFENCENLNLYNVIDINSAVRCATTLQGKKSNSASPSDLLLFNFQRNSNYNGEPIKGGFQKIFISNYPQLYASHKDEITKIGTVNVAKQIEALFYEYYIYLGKVRQLTEKNVNPHFIKVLGGSLSSSYNNMRNYILSHVDPIIQIELLKNINVGDLTEEQLKINFVDNFIYMVHNLRDRPSLTKSNKTSSLINNLNYFMSNKALDSYKNILNFIDQVQYSFILTEQVFMYPTINTFQDFLDMSDGYSITLHEFLELLKKVQRSGNMDEIVKISVFAFYFYFQITSACYALYLSGVNHNDLHAGNVIIKKVKPYVNEYNINGNKWQIYTDFTVLLYDFDRAYCYDYVNMLNTGVNDNVKNNLNMSKDIAKIFYYLFRAGDDITKQNIVNRIANKGQRSNLYNFYMNQPDQWIEQRITEIQLNKLFADPVSIMINLFKIFGKTNDDTLRDNPGLDIHTYICDNDSFIDGNINLDVGLNNLKNDIRYNCDQRENDLINDINILSEKNKKLINEKEDLLKEKEELEDKTRLVSENLV